MKICRINVLMIVLYLLLIPFVNVQATANSQSDIFSSRTPSQLTEESVAEINESEELPSQTTLKSIHENTRDGQMRAMSASDPNDPNNGGWQQGAEYAPISGSPFLLIISVLLYIIWGMYKTKKNGRTI